MHTVDWKAGHRRECSRECQLSDSDLVASTEKIRKRRSAFLYPEFSIQIEEEELEVDESATLAMEKASIWEDARTAGGEGEEADEALTQGSYRHAMGNEASDPEYIHFLKRVQQVYTYSIFIHENMVAWYVLGASRVHFALHASGW